MLREAYIRLNLISMQKYNKKIEKIHENNMIKVSELKNAYIDKANKIKCNYEKTISESEEKIAYLKERLEYLEKQNASLF